MKENRVEFIGKLIDDDMKLDGPVVEQVPSPTHCPSVPGATPMKCFQHRLKFRKLAEFIVLLL